ncbi:hypothetical protein SAMN06265348_11038 [Pedobacter westerhofensis]|uniref:Uncharacterized protein n=1 Tax=Pedobacter westerhofensis TaxID=425512 RepID=A0A521F243_9SPHI|nr:hypothetical protein [Pedobacter westerhofensis]SMO90245.1 hypothetical protein SAMN06265348_11038 [Pedobacter westerhofensis]
MRTSISNLTGEQQNSLHHLNKALKRALNPLTIICYGHRSSINFQSSAFLNSGTVKTNTSVFDIFLMISDDEALSDATVLEIAKRCFAEDIAGNIIVFRLQEVLSELKNRSRFFSSVFRKGILLFRNKNIMQQLPLPLPSVAFITYHEKQQLSLFLQLAQQGLLRAERDLKNGISSLQATLGLLHESVGFSLRYFIGACCGAEVSGDLKELLKFTLNTGDVLTEVFPCNTDEEVILLDVLNLSLIDQGFSPGEPLLRTLFKRTSKILKLSQRAAQIKIAQLLPA